MRLPSQRRARSLVNRRAQATELLQGLRRALGSGASLEQQRIDLERIQRSQTYLLSLINDVLNFAKIESGHLSVDVHDVVVDELVSGTSDFVRPQLRERGLAFTAATCPSPLRVRADREKVQQILLNLLSNALKFTPSGGQITLHCAAGADFVSIWCATPDAGSRPRSSRASSSPSSRWTAGSSGSRRGSVSAWRSVASSRVPWAGI